MIERRKDDIEVREELVIIRTKLEDHLEHFTKHEVDETTRHKEYVKVQEDNTQKIDRLVDQSYDLLEAWQTLDGATKALGALGRLMKWAGSFAVVSWTISYFTHVKTYQ